MFSDKKNANTTGSEPGASQNRINEGTHISGDITSNGFFRIDGFVEGTVTTPSKVVLGKNGVVKGNLSCENADIAGNFTGNLNVSKLLTLRSSANIKAKYWWENFLWSQELFLMPLVACSPHSLPSKNQTKALFMIVLCARS